MKHLSQQMLSIELRKPYIEKQRRRLKEKLRNHGLSVMGREVFRKTLEGLGKPKKYTWDEDPQPGAIDPGPMPVVTLELELDGATFETLYVLPHSRLFLYAQQQGLEVKPGDTKAVVVQTVLAMKG